MAMARTLPHNGWGSPVRAVTPRAGQTVVMGAPGDDIPPPPPLNPMGHGTGPGGERFTITAGGTRAECWTFMDIELPDGRQAGGGGMGGPALPPGRRMNTSEHWADGLHYLVARVDPAVTRLRLEFAGGPSAVVDITPCGTSAELGLAFAGALIPPGRDVADLSAWDADGQCVDRITAWRPPRRPGRP